MRGVYVVRHQIASLSTAKTVLLGTNPAGTLIEILEAYVTNVNQSMLEQLNMGLFLVTTLGSPTGTSKAATDVQKTEQGSGNTVLTWLADLTAEPTAFDANPLHVEGVINVAGYKYEPSPEARRYVGSGKSFGLRILSAPAFAFKAECMITYREIG